MNHPGVSSLPGVSALSLPLLQHPLYPPSRASTHLVSRPRAHGLWKTAAVLQAPHRLRTWLQKCLVFGVPALAIFFGLGAVFYRLYGDHFLHETFLYHAGRQDPRHNFSPHFLFTYLYHFGPVDAAGQPVRPEVPLWLNPGAGAPACMAAALLATAWAFMDDLDVSWLLSTIAFVALNKVSTAQYFVWFLGIFPVVLPAVYAGWGRLQWAAVASFVVSQLLWLSQAYRLEFLVRFLHNGQRSMLDFMARFLQIRRHA